MENVERKMAGLPGSATIEELSAKLAAMKQDRDNWQREAVAQQTEATALKRKLMALFLDLASVFGKIPEL